MVTPAGSTVTPAGAAAAPSGVVVLTDRRLAGGSLPAAVEAAVRGGAGWVVLRERDLPYARRKALAATLRELVPPGRLIVSGPDPLGGNAVHLAATDVLVDGLLTGRSCHRAADLAGLSGEHYVTLSPVYPTRTKPGYGPALTPEGAAGLGSRVPWLALGGVDSAARASRCAAAGAAGVAVMGAVMRADDPARVTRELAAGFAAGKAGFAAGKAGLAAGAAGFAAGTAGPGVRR
jgi:thiamine-phosphate pyrophosphorylase